MKKMLEFGDEEDRITLTIVEYEFGPDVHYEDRNWLVVEATRVHRGKKEVRRNPALMTSDLQRIKQFLEAPEADPELWFLEPVIELTYQDGFVSLSLGLEFLFADSREFDLSRERSSFKSRYDPAWRARSLAAIEDLCLRFPKR